MCDFGRFRTLIVPPNCVEVETRRSSIRKKLRLRTVKPTGWLQWNPLIVMGKYCVFTGPFFFPGFVLMDHNNCLVFFQQTVVLAAMMEPKY